MRQVQIVPTEGQFVAVWIYGGKIWSRTLKWDQGRLMRYKTVDSIEWEECNLKDEGWNNYEVEARRFYVNDSTA